MRTLFIIVLIMAAAAYGFAKPIGANPYSQLIGFQGGGELYIPTQLTAWNGGVFFENVIDSMFGSPLLYGVQIEVINSGVPISSYSLAGGTNLTGIGTENFIELNAAIKLYIQRFSLYIGVGYNDFVSGYMIYNYTTNYLQLGDTGISYFSAFGGLELSAQITPDLFTKIGARYVTGLYTPYLNNTTTGVRFYVAFGYAI